MVLFYTSLVTNDGGHLFMCFRMNFLKCKSDFFISLLHCLLLNKLITPLIACKKTGYDLASGPVLPCLLLTSSLGPSFFIFVFIGGRSVGY